MNAISDPSKHVNFDHNDLIAIRAQGGFMRFDQDESADVAFARQLDYVKSQVYEKKFPEIRANVLVPDSTETPEFAEEFTVRIYDLVGMAKVIANYADDLPRADVRMRSVTVKVKTIGDSYGYSVNEIRASRRTGIGLDQRKALSARRAIEIKIANIKLMGDSAYGLHGLFTHPNLPEFIMPNEGPWSDLDGEEIFNNLVAMHDAYDVQVMGVHRANFLALPPKAYRAALTTRMELAQPTTALQFYRELFPEVDVQSINECQAIKDGHDVALLYENDVTNLTHEYVMPFNQLPPEARNLEFVVNCLARSAGVQIWYPLSLLSSVITDNGSRQK